MAEQVAAKIAVRRHLHAPIALVFQVKGDWEFDICTSKALEAAKASNSSCFSANIVPRFDIFFAKQGEGIVMMNGLQAVGIDVAALKATYRYIVPVGDDDFVRDFDVTFGYTRTPVPFKIPSSLMDRRITGARSVICTGKQIRRKTKWFHGKELYVRGLRFSDGAMRQAVTIKKGKSLKKDLPFYFGDDYKTATFWVSEIPEYDSSYICFVRGNEVCCTKHITGDCDVPPDNYILQKVVHNINEANGGRRSYVLTFGMGQGKHTGRTTYLLHAMPFDARNLQGATFQAIPDMLVLEYCQSIASKSDSRKAG